MLLVALYLVVIATLVVCLVALVDAVRRPSAEYESAGRNKPLWILSILVFELLGAIAYLRMVKREFGGLYEH